MVTIVAPLDWHHGEKGGHSSVNMGSVGGRSHRSRMCGDGRYGIGYFEASIYHGTQWKQEVTAAVASLTSGHN